MTFRDRTIKERMYIAEVITSPKRKHIEKACA